MARMTLTGIVVKKGDTNAVVAVESRLRHPRYKKVIVRTKKIMAHDDLKTKVGDVVTIELGRPVSKRKHFYVTKLVS